MNQMKHLQKTINSQQFVISKEKFKKEIYFTYYSKHNKFGHVLIGCTLSQLSQWERPWSARNFPPMGTVEVDTKQIRRNFTLACSKCF
jgi:hypothetical protein